MFKEFTSLVMFVEDIKQSRDWYCKFLNAPIIEDLEHFVSFQIGLSTLNLHPADDLSPISTGGSVAYWKVEDINSTIERSIKLGAKVHRGPLKMKRMQKIIAQIKDPFGNVFGISADCNQ